VGELRKDAHVEVGECIRHARSVARDASPGHSETMRSARTRAENALPNCHELKRW